MSSPVQNFQSAKNRQSDRFYAKNSSDLTAELMVLNGEEVAVLPCQLADISISGCAVRSSKLTNRDVRVAVLRMKDQNGIVDLEVAGRLCWNQQTSLGSNTFGFRFRREMSPAIINEMVEAGLVTRRQETRIASGIDVQIRRAYGMPAVKRASLEDFSTTGVRLQVDTTVAIGERLLICSVEDASFAGADTARPASGSVTVKWIRPSGDLFECGCIFQNLASSRAINDSFAAMTASVS